MPIGFIESCGKRLKIHSPVSGTIISFNQNAMSNPSALFEDPYFGGWLVKMRPVEIKESIKELLIGVSAKTFLKRNIQDLLIFSQRVQPLLYKVPLLMEQNQLWERFNFLMKRVE